MKLIILIGLLLSLTTTITLAQTADLTVNVRGFKTTKGVCRYRLFQSAEGFPGEESKALISVDAPIAGSTSQHVFKNLPAGTYAVAVVHDENSNHRLDSNFMGIPKEPYGITNDVRGGMGGPPKFEPASFAHAKTGTTVTVAVK